MRNLTTLSRTLFAEKGTGGQDGNLIGKPGGPRTARFSGRTHNFVNFQAGRAGEKSVRAGIFKGGPQKGETHWGGARHKLAKMGRERFSQQKREEKEVTKNYGKGNEESAMPHRGKKPIGPELWEVQSCKNAGRADSGEGNVGGLKGLL